MTQVPLSLTYTIINKAGFPSPYGALQPWYAVIAEEPLQQPPLNLTVTPKEIKQLHWIIIFQVPLVQSSPANPYSQTSVAFDCQLHFKIIWSVRIYVVDICPFVCFPFGSSMSSQVQCIYHQQFFPSGLPNPGVLAEDPASLFPLTIS